MEELLYLTHRIPYPPNKGDKIRSYHLLRHLSTRYRVHLGTFVDEAQDWAHLDKVRGLCGESHFARLRPRLARLRSLSGLVSARPLTLPYYRDAGLKAWVDGLLARRPIRRILVFSSAMAQYAMDHAAARRVVDFVDVDSDKWRQYGARKGWPLGAIYRREGRLLLAFEREVARAFDASLFVSEHEADLFRRLAPESAAKVGHFRNGVDTEYFSPREGYPNPYPEGEQALVFTGAMDYWPNQDAVDWFAREVLPLVRARRPRARFYVVGSRPGQKVRQLAALPGVVVTGAVADVRPYLAHARCAVAPLRIARGVQNKVLEAMAMARPVIASPQALEGIGALAGEELLVARDAVEFVSLCLSLLGRADPGMGRAARDRVLADYGWASNLAQLDSLLAREPRGAAARPHAGPAAAPGHTLTVKENRA